MSWLLKQREAKDGVFQLQVIFFIWLKDGWAIAKGALLDLGASDLQRSATGLFDDTDVLGIAESAALCRRRLIFTTLPLKFVVKP